jgi:hypothetical protein
MPNDSDTSQTSTLAGSNPSSPQPVWVIFSSEHILHSHLTFYSSIYSLDDATDHLLGLSVSKVNKISRIRTFLSEFGRAVTLSEMTKRLDSCTVNHGFNSDFYLYDSGEDGAECVFPLEVTIRKYTDLTLESYFLHLLVLAPELWALSTTALTVLISIHPGLTVDSCLRDFHL